MRKLALAALCGALCACPPAKPPVTEEDAGVECVDRSSCEPGEICEEGHCLGCESTGQCLLKELCNPDTLLCALREGWGNDCATNDQCQAGRWCKQGLCIDRSLVSLCPGGNSSECPQGMRCNTINSVCEEDLGCVENADCGAGEVCNTGSHQCVPRCTVDTQFEVCAPGETCVEERCVQCVADSDCGVGLLCDAAGHCATGQRCYQDRDCKVPLVCHLQTGACLPKQPPCVSDENCALDQRCYLPTGKCIPRSCQPDVFEPNNGPETAYGIAASSYTNLTLCAGDADYFSIALARGDQLGVNLDADPFAESTFTTAVKDSTGRTLAFGKLLASYVASASATYYVAISSSDPYQRYDVTFLRSRGMPCDDDALEPNDVPTQPTAVNAASLLEGAICPQDTDHFGVQVPASKGLRVGLVNYSASAGLLRLCAFDGAVQIGCSEDTLPQLSFGSGDVGGRNVLVRVSGTTDRIANSYTLQVEFP